MQNNFAVTASPHLREKATTQRIMQEVCLALAPAGIAAIIHFGSKAAILIAICVASCVLAEFLWQKIMKQKVTIADWSAVVTGLLLAYNLPSHTPWWMAVIGSFIAIILVKQMFGGIGCNFMNPALTARAILFVSWVSVMGMYMPSAYAPAELAIPTAVDALTVATPLSTLNGGTNLVKIESQQLIDAFVEQGRALVQNSDGTFVKIELMDLLLGNHGGVIGETCALALILGGVYLLVRGIADWRIPVSFIGTVFLCYLIKDGAELALYQILSGGLMLGAFFMATDYATSPITKSGRVIMGVGCGVILFVIRAFCSYPEGCSFAILFMNVATPMIDRFTQQRPFGEVKKHA